MSERLWVAFDCETTGVDPGSRLVELAAVCFDEAGVIRDSFASLVDPGVPMPADAAAVNGLDDAALTGAPDAATVLTAFRRWLPAEGLLLAHNARFDVDLLGWECERCRRAKPRLPVVDSLRLARALADAPSGRLQELARHYGFRLQGEAHRALPDADATRQLWLLARDRLPAARFAELCRGAPFANRWHFPHRLPDGHQALAVATDTRRPLRMRYTDARGSRTTRAVTPWGYAATARGIRFHGYCHLRAGRRNFALERAEWLVEG